MPAGTEWRISLANMRHLLITSASQNHIKAKQQFLQYFI